MNGGANVGSGSFVGSGSIIRGVTLGKNCLVMGVAVGHSYTENSRILKSGKT